MTELADRVGEVIEASRYKGLVKVVDIFNNDTTRLIEVKS